MLVAVYPGPFESHLIMTHSYNTTFVTNIYYAAPAVPATNTTQAIPPFLVPRYSDVTAEFVEGSGGGFAFSNGFWNEPDTFITGDTVKERAEVWYEKK